MVQPAPTPATTTTTQTMTTVTTVNSATQNSLQVSYTDEEVSNALVMLGREVKEFSTSSYKIVRIEKTNYRARFVFQLGAKYYEAIFELVYSKGSSKPVYRLLNWREAVSI